MLERYYYSPYGELEAVVDAHPFDYVLDTTPTAARFDRFAIGELRSRRRVKDDGVVDDFDLVLDTRPPRRGVRCEAPAAEPQPRVKDDREIDADDYNAIEAYVNNLPADGDLQRTPVSLRSLHENPFAHQGLVLDAEIASYQNRARQYAPAMKRFHKLDPLGIETGYGVEAMHFDGLNRYEYVGSAPLRFLDPLGLCTCTVEMKASGTLAPLHLYVHFESRNCGQDMTGNAHWGPCGFIGMCPRGTLNGRPHPPDHGNSSPGNGWPDDGNSANGSGGPQTFYPCVERCNPCACLADIMDAKYPTYFALPGPNSNSAAMEAARKCGVNTSGITGYPGQGISPGDPEDGGLSDDHGCN